MAEVSLDIDAMLAFIRDLENARVVSAGAASDLRGKAIEAGVGDEVTSLGDWTDGLSAYEVGGVIVWCRRAVVIAQQVAESIPGFQAGMEVSFDDALVPTTSLAEVSAAVDALIEALGGRDGFSDEYALFALGDVPQGVLDALSGNTLDPYFSAELARRVSPEHLVGFLGALDFVRRFKVDAVGIGVEGPGPGLAEFDERYREVLDSLALSLSLASRGMGSLAVPGLAGQWSDMIRDESTHPRNVNLLSLVVSRGQWSDDFLTRISDAVSVRQGDQGIGFWAQGQGLGLEVFDPTATSEEGSGDRYDPYWQVTNPWNGLFHAATHNPQIVADWFTGIDRISVAIPDGATTINQRLWDFVHDPDLDKMTIDSLAAAILTATYTPDDTTPQPWQAMLTSDFNTLAPALQEEHDQYVRDNPGWKTH